MLRRPEGPSVPTGPSIPRFHCQGLGAGYGPVTVVRGFNLTAASGTVVAVLGPNGAGKTTLLNTIAAILPAHTGSVAVDGKKLHPSRAAKVSRAGVVLVPDDRSLFGSLTVEENLRVAQGRQGHAIDEIVDRFPTLRKRLRVNAGDLSGGEQQMLAVARALIQQPRVLLIDEMSMGLAPVIVEDLLPMVRGIADETGAVVILVEQHVSLALEVADRAIVLAHGEVVLDSPAAELRRDLSAVENAYLGARSSPPAPVA